MRTIDPLEHRVLLSAVYDSEAALLTVNGTDAGETIDVELFFGANQAANEIRTRVGAVTQVFTGHAPPDRIIVNAGGGNDTLHIFNSGGAGDFYYSPIIEAFGGDGNDRITADFKPTTLHGGAGNDSLQGSNFADLIDGGTGNDELAGSGGNDTLIGGDGNDQIYANDGDDSLSGGPGNDLLRGQEGDDTLVGAAGDDTLDGDRGHDTASYYLDGYHYGNNHISIGDGANDGYLIDHEKDDVTGETENLIGTEGDDTLIGNGEDNRIFGRGGHDLLMGNGGQDRLEGHEWDDTLYGGRGNDTLIGYGGVDHLFGDRGDDLLDGGIGRDLVNGGPGHNTYNEGFFDSRPIDTLVLTGILRYHNGVDGPDWLLQSGATEVSENLLGLDITAVQSQPQKLLNKQVKVTGQTQSQPNGGDPPFRVMIVKKIEAAT